MDKYRREDDVNDDMGVYNHNDVDSSIISERPNKKTYTRGRTNSDNAFEERMTMARSALSPQENKLYDLMFKHDYNVSLCAEKMGISQQMASKYWQRINKKLA